LDTRVSIILLSGYLSSTAIAGEKGYFANDKLHVGLSTTVLVASYNLATGDISGGVDPGICFGISAWPREWYTAGTDMCAAFRLGQGVPNQARLIFLVKFADYINIGIGPTVVQHESPQWLLHLGFGAPINR